MCWREEIKPYVTFLKQYFLITSHWFFPLHKHMFKRKMQIPQFSIHIEAEHRMFACTSALPVSSSEGRMTDWQSEPSAGVTPLCI